MAEISSYGIYLGNDLIGRSYLGDTQILFNPISETKLIFDYIVVAGGGGGGLGGAGGGAGGVVSSSIELTESSTNYSITIGAGGLSGSAPAPPPVSGSNGANSTLIGGVLNISAIGGGGGGFAGIRTGATSGSLSGSNGGSGGGGSSNTGSQGLGTVGQGNDGYWNRGGGGGYTNASTGSGGGAGLYLWWNKYNSGYVADGGGGGASDAPDYGIYLSGIAGGPSGGAGGRNLFTQAQNAPSNGGGGGGGGGISGTGTYSEGFAGNGGSGIVLIRYLGSQIASGGEIYTTGSYTVHAFTASGTFTY